jgi:hypothetical protein
VGIIVFLGVLLLSPITYPRQAAVAPESSWDSRPGRLNVFPGPSAPTGASDRRSSLLWTEDGMELCGMLRV